MTRLTLKSIALSAALALASGPAAAAPEQNTIKLSFGNFDIYGMYSKRACAAQSSLRSAKRARVGFSIYWLPGRKLFVLTNHPGAGKVRGKQQVNFRFPDGQAMAFAMTRQGNALYTDIGFGGQARAFYKLMERSPSVRVEWPALGDAADVSLKPRRQVEAAMRHCRDWLKS